MYARMPSQQRNKLSQSLHDLCRSREKIMTGCRSFHLGATVSVVATLGSSARDTDIVLACPGGTGTLSGLGCLSTTALGLEPTTQLLNPAL